MWSLLQGDSSHQLITDEIDKLDDRSAAIVASAFLEDRLMFAIKKHFKNRDTTIENNFFRGIGPLATFSAKINLGFLMGLYDKNALDMLVSIKKIRNEFAHTMLPITFESPNVTKHYSHMTTPTAFGKRLMEAVENGDHPFGKDDGIVKFAEMFAKSFLKYEDTKRMIFMGTVQIILFSVTLTAMAKSAERSAASRGTP